MAKRKEIQKYSIVDELNKADEKYMNDPSLLGMSMLTWPQYINAMRGNMNTAHLKQFVNLINPDFPYLFAGTENLVGKYSNGYKKINKKLKVVKKIAKFADLLKEPMQYFLFLYDEKGDKYYLVHRTPCESLTENFGYEYINTVIDGLEENDVVEKGTILYRSTSYDEDMNYCYGKNVTVALTLDSYTSEDAAIASKSLCNNFVSIEASDLTIGLNNNDYLINLYGDKKHYKGLPDIGETTSHRFCAIRRQFNNQLLSDFKEEAVSQIRDGDTTFFVDKNCTIIDYEIYSNTEEMVDNSFTKQINQYLRSQNKFYTEVKSVCKAIMDSGSKFERNIEYLYKRASEFLDEQKKWRDGYSEFSNYKIKVYFMREAHLAKGSKVVGRFGNKSVISQVREDEDMPYTKDGRRVDLLLPLPSIINRTIVEPLFEIFVTGAAYQTRLELKKLRSLKQKEKLLFDFISTFDKEWGQTCLEDYQSKDQKGKEAYIQETIDDGIYINQVNLGEDYPMFYKCVEALKKFPYLKETDMYVKKFGREFKVLNTCWLGDMYILKLKQTSRKGFSARSTGAVDAREIPIRSFKSKAHLEEKSTSCIRFGEMENLTLSIAVPTDDLALFNALYRTSTGARKDMVHWMFHDDADQNAVIELKDTYRNTIATIFNVVMKTLGISVEFVDQDDKARVLDDTTPSIHTLDGYTYCCTDYQFYLLEIMYNLREQILEQYPIITKSQLDAMILEILRSKKIIDGNLEKDMENIVLQGTEEKLAKKLEIFTQEAEEEKDPLLDEMKIKKPKKKSVKKKGVETK